MSMSRHESFEELISLSLGGDLTPAERQRLDAHLDACSQCRATLAAFAEQRRIMAGLRHVAPPRDLGARVRTGIERGRFAPLPWWRRPTALVTGVGSLAAVAGALLALVLLNGSPEDPLVGATSTPTPAATVLPEPTETALAPTLPPVPTPTPILSPGETPPPVSDAPSPTPNPVVEAPEPDVVMAVAGPVDDLALSVLEGTTGEEVNEPVTPSGPPIAAELSPDGLWLAYITEIGLRGANDVWATRLAAPSESSDPEASPPTDSTVAVGETIHLGVSTAGSPFLERMAWSPDGRYLAYTIADPDSDQPEADAWILDATNGEIRPLTDVGNAYAASWAPTTEDDGPRLWISTAGDEPASYLHEVSDLDPDAAPIDPAVGALSEAEGIFQPLLSPNGSFAIYWRGRMTPDPGTGWIFTEDGAPYLSEHDLAETPAFASERKLFSDLPTEGRLFGSAAVTWGLDSDAYAIWDATWVGGEQPDEGRYPDPSRVYFGHATDPQGLTRRHAIDRDDIDQELTVVDVEVAPTGAHLLITARAGGGDFDPPRAELRLVTRHTGDVPDEVEIVEISEDGWVGPAVYQPEAEPSER